MPEQNKNRKIPALAVKLLERLMEYQAFGVSGDIEEEFNRKMRSAGYVRALVWLWTQVLIMFPAHLKISIYWSGSMFLNYLKIALRTFVRQKIYSLINITGLAAGMACCMIIFMFVQNELSYDRFHTNSENIYRLRSNMVAQPAPLAPHLKENYPEVIDAVRLGYNRRTVKYNDNVYDEDRVVLADPGLFNLFDFKLLSGNPETALTEPFSVVITDEMSRKYFAGVDPLGKSLVIDNSADVTVTGVLENMPGNSHIQFDFLISFNTLKALGFITSEENWGNHAYNTYLLLDKNVNINEFAKKIESVVTDRLPILETKLTLQPLTGIHLYIEGAITYVKIFSGIAVLVLLIACINFINLTTARVGSRSKEMGVRKVVGCSRGMLAQQFLGESLMMALLSGAVAIALTVLLIPTVNEIADTSLSALSILGNPVVTVGIILIVLVAGLASGVWPALVLSGFNPVTLVRASGKGYTGDRRSVFRRKLLVAVQFAISVFLIISTFVISGQLEYVKHIDLGYEKENLVFLPVKGSIVENAASFKEELLRNPAIRNVTLASSLPSNVTNVAGGMEWEGKPPDLVPGWPFVAADLDYFKTIGIEFASGRGFSEEMQQDRSRAFIVNQTAVEAMKLENPVGTPFSIWGQNGEIVGVLKDFHFQPLHYQIEPLLIFSHPGFYNYVIIRIGSEQNYTEVFGNIQAVWNRYAEGYPFDIKFLDETFDRNYRAEKSMGDIFRFFTMLTLLISCLGLFGLTAFIVEQRTKEIGIRKVLGARYGDILWMVGKEYVVLIIAANLVAWPAALYAMNDWLQNFAFRAPLSLFVFIAAFAIALTVAVITIATQTVRALLKNPVDSLRYE